MSFSDYGETQLLALLAGPAWWLQLHLGPAGENGTLNAAPGMGRAAVAFGAPTGTSPTQVASNAVVNFGTWQGAVFPLTDFVTHWSLWDAASGGNCWATGNFGGLQPRAMLADAAADLISSTVDHGFAADDLVTLTTFPGLNLPAPLARDTQYAVAAAGLTTKAFALSLTDAAGAAVDIAANGACVVKKFVPKLINTDDPVLVGSGEIVVYLD